VIAGGPGDGVGEAPTIAREMVATAGEGWGCDSRYAAHRCLWGRSPDPVAQTLARLLPPDGATVLDAGCGEGRNAVFLAGCGARVRAVDASRVALENGRAAWPGVEGVSWEEADLRTVPLAPSSLDGVLACSVFHWVEGPAEIEEVVERLRRATRPGVLHALSVFNDRVPYEAPAGEQRAPCLLPHAWYLERYADWIVLEESDEEEHGSHRGHREQHTHAVTRLVAMRPAETAEAA